MDAKTPFLVLTGSEDPINDKGKQAQEISNLLIDCGFKAEFKSYEGMRHEPLTEIQRDTVMHKIKEFFGSNI
jgi:alpha-beta hydrolase superfamily lysophospholipase